jgi:hypothetical protein
MFIPHERIDDYLPRWSGEGFDADILKIVKDINLRANGPPRQSIPSWISH